MNDISELAPFLIIPMGLDVNGNGPAGNPITTVYQIWSSQTFETIAECPEWDHATLICDLLNAKFKEKL